MFETLEAVMTLMSSHGAKRFYAKVLAANDNSKNQIYLGGDFSALNILPHQEIHTDISDTAGSKRDRAKAQLSFFWVDQKGLFQAPYAQLILYPKYPEVRMSGFLKGCELAPSDVLTVRQAGRVLVLGITSEGNILGYAAFADSPVARQLQDSAELTQSGVFIDLNAYLSRESSRTLLLAKLRSIYVKSWIPSCKLGADGIAKHYVARNGGGYTLEAELGISPNGYSEPDYLGWEVKQYSVSDFLNFQPKSPVTLMTPEPTGGIYRDQGVDSFIHKFGYADTAGRPDRLNFGGIYDVTKDYHQRTGLRLTLDGYDEKTGKIDDIDGGILLISNNDEVAARWKFIDLIAHWNRKHAQAVYVPSMFRNPPPEYCYGSRIMLCAGTDFGILLQAIAKGLVYYDPGIKMEEVSSSRPKIKRRSQFRVNHRDLHTLYRTWEIVNFNDIDE